jgi:type VI secretion system protein ImpF
MTDTVPGAAVPPPDPFQALKPSVLDRLIDAGSEGTTDRPGYTLRQMEDAVRRDLEDLLNTRRPPESAPGDDGKPEPFFGGLEEVPRSIVNFGLRDLAYFDTLTADVRAEFARHIEQVITTYEPRLRDIHVTVRDPAEVAEAKKQDFKRTALYFHIEARLNLDPAPEVMFETVLELTKGTHQVTKGE